MKIIVYVIVFFLFTWNGTVLAAADSLVATDGEGKLPTVAKSYNRIISLYSAHTENLVSLKASDQIIGISRSDDYPETILTKPRFSYRDGLEKFIAASPDLVLVRPMIERACPQLLGRLRQAGIKVISLQPTSVEGIFDYWRALGGLTGREEGAENMIESFKAELKQITKKVRNIPQEQRPRVYFEAIHKRMKTFAPQSIATFVLEEAGGINIANDAFQVRKTNIAAYGKERILGKAMEIDFFIAQKGRMNPINHETITNEPGFQAIRAVRKGNVFLINENLVSRPTLRILEGVRQLSTILYPDGDVDG